jgi:radical SAM superfamily enzyme YgiQ (UPF0313 family)
MRILFITPRSSGRYGRPSTPPVGIAYLATFLRDNGHKIKAIDLRVEGPGYDYIAVINDFDADIVGVSFMSHSYKDSYALINRIKKKTKARVVIGGAHPSTLKHKVLEECDADFAVYKEGEYALLELAQGMPKKDIKNLIWRDGENIVVNA